VTLLEEENRKAHARNERILNEFDATNERLRKQFGSHLDHANTLENQKVQRSFQTSIPLFLQKEFFHAVLQMYPNWHKERIKKDELKLRQMDDQMGQIEKRRKLANREFAKEIQVRESLSQKVTCICNDACSPRLTEARTFSDSTKRKERHPNESPSERPNGIRRCVRT
jgi:hypothetical protein